jgi:hypothetical protein
VVIDKAHSADNALNCSALAEIQRKIIKKGKRGAVFRFIHSKGDKETIASWKAKLSKALLIFNVRSIVVVWLLLTVHSQTELALNNNAIVSGIDRNVTEIHAIVSNIDSTVIKIQEGTDRKDLLVSITCALFVTERTLTVT